MKNKQIIGLVVAGAVFIVTGVTSVLTNTLSANTMAEDVTTMLAGELEFDPPADELYWSCECSGDDSGADAEQWYWYIVWISAQYNDGLY